MTRLTLRRLNAIEEALSSRLAGEMDISVGENSFSYKDYYAAYDWVSEQISKRTRSDNLRQPDGPVPVGRGT
jgi:hypothetical protein